MTGKRILSAMDKHNSLSNIFRVKNFILTDTIKLADSLMLEKGFICDGSAVLICQSGEGVVRVNYHEYTLKKNQVFIIIPYHIISLKKLSDDFSVAGLFCSNDYFTRNTILNHNYDRLFKFKQYPIITFTGEQMDRLMELHDVMMVRYKNLNNPYNEECLTMLIFSFFAEIINIHDINKPNKVQTALNRQEKITDEFFRLLINNFKEQRAVAFYADKLCFTPKYLSSVVKKVTGYTIQEWINEMVINHTKNLLKMTDKTVLEISEELNFSNPSFFGRFFKQYTGLTPLQFRNG